MKRDTHGGGHIRRTHLGGGTRRVRHTRRGSHIEDTRGGDI